MLDSARRPGLATPESNQDEPSPRRVRRVLRDLPLTQAVAQSIDDEETKRLRAEAIPSLERPSTTRQAKPRASDQARSGAVRLVASGEGSGRSARSSSGQQPDTLPVSRRAGGAAEAQADALGDRIAADPRFRDEVSEGILRRRLGEVAEAHLGVRIAGVRLRADTHAQETAESTGSLAVAEGSEISFGPGQLGGDDRGRRLLAHELVHVAQQHRHGSRTAQRQPKGASATGDPFSLDMIRRDLERPPRLIGVFSSSFVPPAMLYGLGFLLIDRSSPQKYRHAKGHEVWLVQRIPGKKPQSDGEGKNGRPPLTEQEALDRANALLERVQFAYAQIIYGPSALRNVPPEFARSRSMEKYFRDYDRLVSEIGGLFVEMRYRLPELEQYIGVDREGDFGTIEQQLFKMEADYVVYGPDKIEEMRQFRQTWSWGEPAKEPPPYQAPPEE